MRVQSCLELKFRFSDILNIQYAGDLVKEPFLLVLTLAG